VAFHGSSAFFPALKYGRKPRDGHPAGVRINGRFSTIEKGGGAMEKAHAGMPGIDQACYRSGTARPDNAQTSQEDSVSPHSRLSFNRSSKALNRSTRKSITSRVR
jgi:hypothetical protein